MLLLWQTGCTSIPAQSNVYFLLCDCNLRVTKFWETDLHISLSIRCMYCNSVHHCVVCVQGCPCLCDQWWSAERHEQWRVRWGTTEPSRDGVCKNVPSAETDHCGELSTSGTLNTHIHTHLYSFKSINIGTVKVNILIQCGTLWGWSMRRQQGRR